MYSGSDSTESPNYSQWPLNPTTYQNMSNEQVDWAALAQQWILMKEAGPPPIPDLQNSKKPQKSENPIVGREVSIPEGIIKGGPLLDSSSGITDIQPPGDDSWNWKMQQSNWEWNNAWPSHGVPSPISLAKSPLLPTPQNFNQYSVSPEYTNDSANITSGGNHRKSDYGSSSSKHVKPHNRRYSKVNIPRSVQSTVLPSNSSVSESVSQLDSAKRKQLPAWIREGLEKMERDKLKQMERAKEKQEHDQFKDKFKQTDKETLEILKNTMREQQKSKFESDGENSDVEIQIGKKLVTQEPPIALTHEELMLQVRRTMTEILLKVTTSELEAICTEEWQRYIKKRKASDQHVSAPSGANISAKLGLGAYGNYSGSSSDESDQSKDDKDSDLELKDAIRKLRADFAKKEVDIEEKLAEAESRKRVNISRSTTPDVIDSENQVDARTLGRRIQPRLPSPPDIRGNYNVKVKSPVSTPSDNSDSNSKSKRRRRSLTVSSDSPSINKRKQRSRSRSYTPNKRDRYKSSTSRRSPSKSVEYNKRSSPTRSHRNNARYTKRSRSRSVSRDRSNSSSYRKSSSKYSRERSTSRSRKSRSSSYSKRSYRSRSNSYGRRSRQQRSRSSSKSRSKRSYRY